MKKLVFGILLGIFFCIGGATFAMEQQPVAFIVQDYTGEMENVDYKLFKQVTRWAYRFPYFEIKEFEDVAEASKMLSAPTLGKNDLQKAMDLAKVDILVLVRVYDLEEEMDHRMCSFENGPLVRVRAEADLVVYRRDKDKILVDNVREGGTYDLGNYEKPAETIKWRLCDLVNTMEDRELIR